MAILKKNEIVYLVLVLFLIVSKLVLNDSYPADQFIVYNFLTLSMMGCLAKMVFKNHRILIDYFPLIILLYIFLTPKQLIFLFTAAHILIILIIALLIFRHINISNIEVKKGFALIPIEILILISF